MSKKEGNADDPSNVISPGVFAFPESIEVVPYLNKGCDGVQDILSEVEENTIGLQRDFMAKNSLGSGNVIGVDFSCVHKGKKIPEI
jgi:hypothetical protein